MTFIFRYYKISPKYFILKYLSSYYFSKLVLDLVNIKMRISSI